MGDHDLLGSPGVQPLRRLRPVGQAGQNLRLGGVGLEEVHIGQVFLLIRPVAEAELSVFVVAEEALHVGGYHALSMEGLNELVGEVPVEQSRQVVEPACCIRDFLREDGIGLGGAGGVPPLPVWGKIDVFHKGCLF